MHLDTEKFLWFELEKMLEPSLLHSYCSLYKYVICSLCTKGCSFLFCLHLNAAKAKLTPYNIYDVEFFAMCSQKRQGLEVLELTLIHA